jgi:3-hydroxymyristoyl/3-hydroxydecanoyl-(acyl carrier protein) dehydratase
VHAALLGEIGEVELRACVFEPVQPVVPRDTLLVYVEEQRNRSTVWKFSGRAKVGDVLVAEATYAAMIRDS